MQRQLYTIWNPKTQKCLTQTSLYNSETELTMFFYSLESAMAYIEYYLSKDVEWVVSGNRSLIVYQEAK